MSGVAGGMGKRKAAAPADGEGNARGGAGRGQGRKKQATAIALDKERGSFHAALGRAFEGQSEWEKAMGAFEEALRLEPDDRDSSRRLAGIKWRVRATRSEK